MHHHCKDWLPFDHSSELDSILFALALLDFMNQVKKETISIRAFNVGFSVIALGVFKPFGLDAWQWDVCFHLLAIWVLGMAVCGLTELILKYMVKMPRSLENGVSYIIRRNLWFQLINTPLISLMICLYRHFVLSSRVKGNLLSWENYLETLIIIAFISFSIGLYWRFKFRSRYLALELEDTRMLNEQLKALQHAKEQHVKETEEVIDRKTIVDSQIPTDTPLSSIIVLKGTTSDTVSLNISDLLYIEAIGNYVKVYHLRDGQICTDMLRATSKQIEDELQQYPMIVRCHRAFLVNLGQVEQIVSKTGSMQLAIRHCHVSVPVSRSNIAQIKAAVKGK